MLITVEYANGDTADVVVRERDRLPKPTPESCADELRRTGTLWLDDGSVLLDGHVRRIHPAIPADIPFSEGGVS